jgi:GDPmannose 4,6-dehydratase
VRVSFDMPEYTADVNALGPLRLLEAMRILRLDSTRFYQAGTSELYGNGPEAPQNERTPFRPRSPYGIAKLHAFWTTVNYREACGFHASNGILFNHESQLRGETFVSRKVTRGVAAITQGFIPSFAVGNLDAERDWGHARDYVEGIWLMLQQPEPGDYVLATGVRHSVRYLIERAFTAVDREIVWVGKGLEETGRDKRTGADLVRIDPRYFRPTDVDRLIGDASKAREKLGWRPVTSFETMIAEMVDGDLKTVRREYEGSGVR